MIVQLMNEPTVTLTECPDTLDTFYISLNSRIRVLNRNPHKINELNQKLLTAFVEVLNKTNETHS